MATLLNLVRHSYHIMRYQLLISCLNSVSVKTSFSLGTDPIFPRNIQCSGDEKVLSNCTATENDHMECKEVAGVICEGLLHIKCPFFIDIECH